MDPLVISYRFDTKDGTHAEFDLLLDPETLELPAAEGDLPEWTALEFKQCPHCPLDPEEHPRIGFYYIVEDREYGQQYLTIGDDLYWYVDPSTWATAVLRK